MKPQCSAGAAAASSKKLKYGGKKINMLSLKRVATSESDTDDFDMESSVATHLKKYKKSSKSEASFEILEGSFSKLKPMINNTSMAKEELNIISCNGGSNAVNAPVPSTSTPLQNANEDVTRREGVDNGLMDSLVIYNEVRKLLNERLIHQREAALGRHQVRTNSLHGGLGRLMGSLEVQYTEEIGFIENNISALREFINDIEDTIRRHEKDLTDVQSWQIFIRSFMGQIVKRLPSKYIYKTV